LIPGVHAASHFFKSLIRTSSFIEGFWLTKPSAMSPIRGTTSASELLIVHPGDRIHQAPSTPLLKERMEKGRVETKDIQIDRFRG
jgi:hypothetical protein